ncbi:MAG TPA: LytR C-terminal domain-containing protein [Gaiellaceae bacterium]|nr:LytR C-terminal domain-containing protein [Gaiellaceae bacterium]
MDAPLPTPDLVRPWRTATLVASLVAAIELVLLIGAGVLLLAKPLAHLMKRHAETAAFAPAKKHVAPAPARHVQVKTPAAKLSRSHTGVLVLNGNGRAGAASAEAATLHGLGYAIRGTANAKRQDYATTVVMYRKGYAGEGARLARDLHVKIVGPLDGLAPAALHGGQLAVVLGAD